MYEKRMKREDLQPVNFEPFKISNVLTDEVLKIMQHECNHFRREKIGQFDDKEFNRRYVHNPLTLKVIHHTIILPLAEKLLCRKLMPSYSFLSLYESNGKCPKHYDRPQCRYTVDLCLNQNGVWPFFAETEKAYLVDGTNAPVIKPVLLRVNEAAVLSGTRHFHWRDDMNPDDHNFCDMAFFHFVDADYTGGLN